MILETGCYVDCSHLSAADLHMRVIEFAESLGWAGWTGMTYNLRLIHSDWHHYTNGTVPPDWKGDEDDFFIDYQDHLAYLCDAAVEWLNDDSFGPENIYWTIDDNCLYLWEDKNEDL